ncbi:hypothetical protein [Rubrivirga sp. IMCC45206]|uniref:hypothetical protein n=1 Tax=Rubrivirga sp. IMCC45206 TaxID=3391614 RepID=UPI0039900773
MRPLFLFVALAAAASAQVDEGILPMDDPVQRFLQRQQTAGTLDGVLLTTFPLSAYEAQAMLDSLAVRVDSGGVRLSPVDRASLDRYRGLAPAPGAEWGRNVGIGLYDDGESLVSADGDGYAVRGQPLMYLTHGPTRRTGGDGRDPRSTSFRYSRGLRVAGHAGPVFFDTQLMEVQEVPERVEWSTFTTPRQGFTKINDARTTYDYWDASGIVGFRASFFEVRAGRGRANWGFGEGSLERSDYSAPQDHVEFRSRFWRVRYTNRFERRIRPIERSAADRQLYPRSFTALHQLAFDLPYGLEAELFEMTVFADDTTGGQRSGFELAYLNPLVFYRAVEADLGTLDNALLGAGLAWNAAPGYRTYGQLLLDELAFGRLSDDWWGNKWGFLLGAHVVDPGWGEARVRGLSLRGEYTRQRPYLYSHRSASTAYVHYADPLGHPAGPNSSDLSLWAEYLPTPRLSFGAHGSYTVRGRNTETENFGSDASLSYVTRVTDNNATTLQGVRQRETIGEVWGGYELLPELILGLGARYHAFDDAETGLDRTATGFVQLRWGLPYQTSRF